MTDPNAQPQHRYRIRFGKSGMLRYTSHLDVARVWERVFRRAGLPVVYSQGFNPRPKIHLAAALPLGYASIAEVLDVWLDQTLDDLSKVIGTLAQASPPGLEIYDIRAVDGRAPALQTVTEAATYEVEVGESLDPDSLRERIKSLLAQDSIWRERRDKRYDLRPLIYKLTVLPDDPRKIEMKLALAPQAGTGRADEVIEALGLDSSAAWIVRTAIHFAGEGGPNLVD